MKRVGIDIGGTFTDLVWYDEETGILQRSKVLTESDHPEQSFLKVLKQARVEHNEIDLLLHATTLVTNLLINRRGARIGLITTLGYRDLLDIQLSIRPNPFNYVFWNKRPPLVPRRRRIEVEERLANDGSIVTPLNEAQVEAAARQLGELGVQGVAVCFLHSFVNPVHEVRVGEIVSKILPGVPVSLSHEVDPTIREYERTSTTVTNSYAQPAVWGYIGALEAHLPVPVRYMHSGGGIMPADTARKFPVMLAASGPAAGVLAGVYLAKQETMPNLITFDMGGTSTDVALIRDAEPTMRDAVEIDWNMPARTLSIDVKSVGAGGGSIAWVDPGNALMVGPQSAGAKPGPVCYGFGGVEPAVTDANLILGLIREELNDGRLKLDTAGARAALERLGANWGMGAVETARSIYRVVNTNMVFAIRQITVERGIDPRDFHLASFGGAGGQHAVAVANELGMRSVIFAPQASTFSALGLLTADLTISQAQTLFGPWDQIDLSHLDKILDSLAAQSQRHLECDVEGASDAVVSALLDLRYIGQSHYVSVPYSPAKDDHASIFNRFEDAHEVLFGTRMGDAVELVNVRAVVRRELPGLKVKYNGHRNQAAVPSGRRWSELDQAEIAIVDRESISAAANVIGPAIVEEVDSSHYIPLGWTGRLGKAGSIIVERGE
jgi:N-methylhydantoinase A